MSQEEGIERKMASQVRIHYHLVSGVLQTTGQEPGKDLPLSCKSSEQLWEANGRAPEASELQVFLQMTEKKWAWLRFPAGMLKSCLG